MNKSLVVLTALLVAVLTWYIGERFYDESGSGSAVPLATQTSAGNQAQTAGNLSSAKSKEQSDAAKLAALLKGQNAAALAAARLAASNANAALNSALEDEYSQAYDAIYNKTDILFNDAKTSKASIKVSTGNSAILADINAKRQQITVLLDGWKASDAPIIVAYLSELQTIVQSLTPGNSGLTQAQINAYEAAVVEAQAEINKAIAAAAEAQAQATLAEDQLLVQEDAGNPEAIQQEEQAVSDDQANIAALEAQIAQEEADNGNNTVDITNNNGDNGGNGDAGSNGSNGQPSYSYTIYTPEEIAQMEAQFQEIIKNNPPELVNF